MSTVPGDGTPARALGADEPPPARSAAAPGGEAADASAVPQPIRVLLIEDNIGDARLVSQVLRTLAPDAVVEHSSHAAAALRRLERDHFDVLVVDQGLPGMSGLELGQQVRELSPSVALVMLTGEGDELLAVRALKSGFDDYVIKDVGLAYRELLPMTVLDVLRRRADRIARERAERALRESEERYGLAVRGANDAIWDWDLRTDRLYLSPRWSEMLGLPVDESLRPPDVWFERVHAEDLPQLQQDIQAHFDGLTPHLQAEYRVRHANGSWRWVLCRGLCVRSEKGLPLRIAGSQTDITERRVIEERLFHDAFHDPLTGLSNRAHFLDRLRRVIRLAPAAGGGRFAVLFLDLDHFKVVNDSLGHVVGDQLLVKIAQRLAKCARSSDTLARLGGDEFALLVEGKGAPKKAEEIAERLSEELRRPFEVAGRELVVTASTGIALGDGNYHEAEDVLRDADTAMYRAKAEARSSYRIFDPSMHEVVSTKLDIEGELRQALSADQLRVHYQPIVSLSTGRIIGFEALVRWEHPTRGLIGPDSFIAVAEESGLVVALGRQVFRTACAQLKAWHAAFPRTPPLLMSVNISAREFADGALMRRLGKDLADSGVPPRSIRLEMTETAIMASEQSVAAKLWQLRALEVGIALDDFGTGYSSLSYLRHFPIDALKIDRSFVQGVVADMHDATIVRTIVELASSLGMDVTAEGVETTQQFEWLRLLKCPSAQGYYFTQAVDADAATRLLEEDRRW